MPNEYVHRRRVHFIDTDAAGIIHYSNYFRYMEEAETEFLFRCADEAGVPRSKFFIAPRVKATAEFVRPVRFGDLIDIHLKVDHLGQSSIGYAFDFRHEGEQVAHGSLRIVCVERDEDGKYKPTPIPEALRAVLTMV